VIVPRLGRSFFKESLVVNLFFWATGQSAVFENSDPFSYFELTSGDI